jgi:hypothetical protein
MNQEKTLRKWREQKKQFASAPRPTAFVISPRFVVSSWRFAAILLSFVAVVAFTETAL